MCTLVKYQVNDSNVAVKNPLCVSNGEFFNNWILLEIPTYLCLMRNKYSYAWQKHLSAINSLVSSGNIQHRMIGAISALNQLDSDGQLPPDILKEFREFMSKMKSSNDIGDEGVIHSTVMSMTDDELEMAAKKIVEFFSQVSSTMDWN